MTCVCRYSKCIPTELNACEVKKVFYFLIYCSYIIYKYMLWLAENRIFRINIIFPCTADEFFCHEMNVDDDVGGVHTLTLYKSEKYNIRWNKKWGASRLQVVRSNTVVLNLSEKRKTCTRIKLFVVDRRRNDAKLCVKIKIIKHLHKSVYAASNQFVFESTRVYIGEVYQFPLQYKTYSWYIILLSIIWW